MPPVKLILIGAGSQFTFHIVADLIRHADLAGSTVALVDTDVHALDLSAQIVSQMVSKTGADLRVVRSADRRDLLPGSDFVFNTISVGEPWARQRDVEIGEREGIYQPTSQTVGPAGFVRGLRVIPHAVAIARDIADLCPNATVINLANPLAAVCRAMIREADLAVVGLCEQWRVTLRLFADVLDVRPDELDCLSVGANHLTWALALHHKGRDRLPEFLDRLHAPTAGPLRDTVPVSRDIYAAFGLWPTGSEDHIAEFFPYFLTPETHGGADYGLTVRHTTQEQVEQRRAEREALADGRKSLDGLLGPSGESAVDVLRALLCDQDAGIHMVNISNAGLIDNLPDTAIVELPAYVSPAGARGLKVGPMPQPIAQILANRAIQQELLIDAALSGNPQTALQGLVLDAQIVSLGAASRILEASLEANAQWLPNFH